jgi:putative membrane protein
VGSRLFDALVLAQADGWDDHMDWDGGWWIVMAIGMVLFWALVIVGVVWLVRNLSHHEGASGYRRTPAEDPLGILDRRLAEGSIEVEEYERRKRTLTGAGG